MSRIEIFYLVLLVILLGVVTVYAYTEYRKGKAKMLKRKMDGIRRKEELQEEVPEIYREIYESEEVKRK